MIDGLPEPTPQMVTFFERRTCEHIARVRHCLIVMAKVTQYSNELLERASTHDMSKFQPEERLGYIWVTEYFRHYRSGQVYSYPPGIEALADAAADHHYRSNRHHFEFHANPADMTDVDLIELVCDWTAMAQEYEPELPTARTWAKKVLGKRWHLPPEREQFVFDMIDLLDRHLPAESLENIVACYGPKTKP